MSDQSPAERAEIERLLDLLDESPGWLQQAFFGQDERALRAKPPADAGGDAWNALEILAHLRASDGMLTARIFALAVRDGLPISDLDERRWAEVGRYIMQPVEESLASLATRRRELLVALRLLAPEVWRHSGVHELRGPMSLAAVVRHLAEHEDSHRAQLETALAAARA